MSNPDEQAFPIPADEDHVRSRGLTKREYIAAHIMAAETAHDLGDRHLAKIAEHAVKAADYLLAELAKQS